MEHSISADSALIFFSGILSIVWGILFLFFFKKSKITRFNYKEFISWFLIIGWFAARTIVFQRRSDPSALLAGGLTVQNILQVVITGLAALWSFILILNKEVKLKTLWTGPLKWCIILFFFYTISTIWSVWPIFTLFRAIELITLFVIGIYLFTRYPWYDQLRIFLLWGIVIPLLAGFIAPGGNTFAQGIIVGAIRSNGGSMMAAMFLLLVLHRIFYLKLSVKIWEILFPIVAIIIFGSLASAIAFVISFLLLIYYKVPRMLRPVVFLINVFLIVFNIIIVMNNINFYVRNIADLFGKKPEHIMSFTGRVPLWIEISKIIEKHPAGLGFAAGERTFAVYMSNPKEIGWSPSHAHSGYISAWLGIGWLGLFLSFFLVLIIWRWLFQVSPQYRHLLHPLLALIAINNFSIMGLGGQFNGVWIIVIALIAAGFKSKIINHKNFVSPQLLPTNPG